MLGFFLLVGGGVANLYMRFTTGCVYDNYIYDMFSFNIYDVLIYLGLFVIILTSYENIIN